MICVREEKGATALLKYMPPRIYGILGKMPIKELLKLEELRFGEGLPITAVNDNGNFYVTEEGRLSENRHNGTVITEKELSELFALLCNGSVYAIEENIKSGYFTTENGNRVGVCGVFVYRNGAIEGIRKITFLNIRIAKEIIGCADGIIDIIAEDGVKNTLVISPPGGGKTTILRDICRLLGNKGLKVAIADERGEISSCRHSKINACVIEGCPKVEASEMLLRSMGPQVIVTDEIGGDDDKVALQKLLRCGVKVIASVHGNNFDDATEKMPFIRELFECIVVLENKRIKEVKVLGK